VNNTLAAKWLKGHASAVEFVLLVHQIVELWDDLIDLDKPVTREEIDAAFYAALIQLPRNAFYRENFGLLNPVFESVILDWFTSNALEKTGKEDSLRIAFVLRCGVLSLTAMSARIIGGVKWAQQVNLELRAVREDWAEYLAKVKANGLVESV